MSHQALLYRGATVRILTGKNQVSFYGILTCKKKTHRSSIKKKKLSDLGRKTRKDGAHCVLCVFALGSGNDSDYQVKND